MRSFWGGHEYACPGNNYMAFLQGGQAHSFSRALQSKGLDGWAWTRSMTAWAVCRGARGLYLELNVWSMNVGDGCRLRSRQQTRVIPENALKVLDLPVCRQGPRSSMTPIAHVGGGGGKVWRFAPLASSSKTSSTGCHLARTERPREALTRGSFPSAVFRRCASAPSWPAGRASKTSSGCLSE